MRTRYALPIFTLGMIMLGVASRVPFSPLPTVFADIAAYFQVDVSTFGILTSIPLMMFAVISSFAPALARKIGTEKAIALALICIIVGSLVRITNLPMLYVGTVLLGAAIAVLNVLFPSAIRAHHPERVGMLTTAYTVALGASLTVATAVAVPVTASHGWQGYVLLLSMGAIIALATWIPQVLRPAPVNETKSAAKDWSLLRSPKVWAMLVLCGFQSALFYTYVTWMPEMVAATGLTHADGAVLLSIFAGLSVPIALVVPQLVTKLPRAPRLALVTFMGVSAFIGTVLALLAGSSFVMWVVAIVFLAIAIHGLFPYILVAFSLKTNSPAQTASLSGIVQAGGYLLASIAPTVVGFSFSVSGSWVPGSLLLCTVAAVVAVMSFYVEKQEKIID